MVEGRGQRIPRADGEERALRGGDWGWDGMGWGEWDVGALGRARSWYS